MVDTTYRVLPGVDGSFDVQMAKPSGQTKTATGFGSEHEANAWIVQAKRMKRDAAPWTPIVPRKPGETTTASQGPATVKPLDGALVRP
jgi:hypothetical protein